MPPYCQPEDLARYGVKAEALGSLSEEEHQEPPIEAASAKIDSYLRQQYVLPLTRVGSDIKECCAIIAAWRVLSVRGIKPGENPEDSSIYLAYREQLRWLELIASGKVSPDVDDSDTTSTLPGAQAGVAQVVSNSARGYQAEEGGFAGPFQGSRR